MALLARAAPNLSSFISPPLWNLESAPDDAAEEDIEAAQRSSANVNDSPSHARQVGGAERPELREMSGHEDLLLGRDFLRHDGILLVIDSENFSLLLPDDEDNRRRRDQVRRALE
ncbi:hypothetical protein ACSRUE_10915 [Sorangium sp. KYC3313]|uniref:hypothetical protein n=1 Tax=Sorangium sp. KYC3313 TaxID=3449740 RepID=UPI003F8ACD7D